MENSVRPWNQNFFNDIAKQFDLHVKQSIPLFSQVQNNIVNNITSFYEDSNIIDICGSTGELGRQLIFNGFAGKYTCVDASPYMQDVFNASTPEGSKKYLSFELAAFNSEPFTESYNGKDIEIKSYENNNHFNISVEVLGFQFFTKDRAKNIELMRDMSDLCIFFEKFAQPIDIWDKHENLKNTLHKPKFFTQAQIEKKQTEVLNDMGDYLYNQNEFDTLLRSKFYYVSKFAQIGNFAGYVCSSRILRWRVDPILLKNKFTI